MSRKPAFTQLLGELKRQDKDRCEPIDATLNKNNDSIKGNWVTVPTNIGSRSVIMLCETCTGTARATSFRS